MKTTTIILIVLLLSCMPAVAPAPPVLMPGIATPTMVVDMDTDASFSETMSSTSATPAENSIVICIEGTIDNVITAHPAPTDTWDNNDAWIALEDDCEAVGFICVSMDYTIIRLAPTAGVVTIDYSGLEEHIGAWMALIEVTGVQLRSPIIDSSTNEGTGATLGVTVTGTTLNNVIISGIMCRDETGGITTGSGETQLDQEQWGGAQDGTAAVGYSLTDLTANWTSLDDDGPNSQQVGVAVLIRGLRRLKVSEGEGEGGPKVRLLSYVEYRGGKRVL